MALILQDTASAGVADTGTFRLTANIGTQGFTNNIGAGTYFTVEGNANLWNGTQAVIPGGRKYVLEYHIVGTISIVGALHACWVDASNNTAVGATMILTPVTVAASVVSGNIIRATVAPTANTNYTIRWVGGDPGAILTLIGGGANAPASSVIITQL